MVKEELFKKAYDAIVESDEDEAMESVDIAADIGVDSLELLTEGFSAGMNYLGEQFAEGEVSLPELIFASEVMKAITDRIGEEKENCLWGSLTENRGWMQT